MLECKTRGLKQPGKAFDVWYLNKSRLTSLQTSIVPKTTCRPSKKLSPMRMTVAPPVVQPSLGLIALMQGVAASETYKHTTVAWVTVGVAQRSSNRHQIVLESSFSWWAYQQQLHTSSRSSQTPCSTKVITARLSETHLNWQPPANWSPTSLVPGLEVCRPVWHNSSKTC